MQHHNPSLFGSRSMAILGIVCALGLTSCSDENTPSWWKRLTGKKEKAVATAPAATPEAAKEAPAATADEKELLNYMIFTVGDLVRRQASNPTWHNEVRDMRNRLDDYYTKLEQNGGDMELRVKLGLLLADATRDLAAHQKALDLYAHVLQEWETLPEETRTTPAFRRIRSSIANGMGSCYLSRNKPADALPYYETALKLDEERFKALAPADGGALPMGDSIAPDLVQAAEDVLSSYRCLGECQLMTDDSEEARDSYKRGIDLARRMNNLQPSASLQYIRLHTALGNLESRCGQTRQALLEWREAAQWAQKLRQAAPSPAVQAQTARILSTLEPLIRAAVKQLQETQAAAAESQPTT